MKVGFVGAGKVGFSLGKYLTQHNIQVCGYYSEFEKDAIDASEFTNSRYYNSLVDLVEDSDVLFITVTDGAIKSVCDQLEKQHINGKIVCHCSGALSSEIFLGLVKLGNFGYSIHPLFAVSNRYDSYKELPNSYFTIEGTTEKLQMMKELFESFGNKVVVIDKDAKVKYHAAAAICSNLVVGLINMSENLLVECGFDKESAAKAIAPIMFGNMNHIVKDGTVKALTGPIERDDIETVKKHISCLNEGQSAVYKAVSREVLKVAKEKNKDRNYKEMEELLQ